ncbi:SDR family oxidoreductase [bacterium]|nr:MAG: SDR family oxidoreductase [bacterium]
MSKFLVTGGAGFIGSHIVDRLVQLKYRVKVLDNFSSGRKENLCKSLSKIDLVRGDIRSKEACRKATKGMEVVLHQAALRSVPKSLVNPAIYNEVNIQGTLNLLQAAVENKVSCFVFASSSSVYGDLKDFPEKTDFLPQPISPYALTKLAGEHYCRMFSCHYNLPTVSLRYFNVFGPRQSLDDEYAVVVPKFIDCMLHDEQPPIYGTGKQSRDFTFVSNVVDANLLACPKRNLKGDVFNIAAGRDYSVLDLVRLLNKIIGKNIRPVFLKLRPGDVFRTMADISLSRKILGFRPKINFEEGLNIALKYYKEQ